MAPGAGLRAVHRDEDRAMNLGVERWIGVFAGLSAGLALLYYMYGPSIQDTLADAAEEPAVAEAEPAPAPEAAAAPVEPAPHYPVPEAPVPAPALSKAKPMPSAPAPAKAAPPATAKAGEADTLAASDETVREAVEEVFGVEPVESFLIPERIIQNIVTTVDSLDRDPIPLRFRAVSNVPEVPVVEKDGDTLTLSVENGDRYRTLIATLQDTDAKAIAALYLRYYPLFQQAYREMGYPGAHFNDRVVKIIDHLRATPDVPGPIELVRPKVLYLYADPALEELSSGQKMMIRIGPQNAAIVKAKLAEVRAHIVGGRTAAATSG
jgi:hypothetical protein